MILVTKLTEKLINLIIDSRTEKVATLQHSGFLYTYKGTVEVQRRCRGGLHDPTQTQIIALSLLKLMSAPPTFSLPSGSSMKRWNCSSFLGTRCSKFGPLVSKHV